MPPRKRKQEAAAASTSGRTPAAALRQALATVNRQSASRPAVRAVPTRPCRSPSHVSTTNRGWERRHLAAAVARALLPGESLIVCTRVGLSQAAAAATTTTTTPSGAAAVSGQRGADGGAARRQQAESIARRRASHFARYDDDDEEEEEEEEEEEGEGADAEEFPGIMNTAKRLKRGAETSHRHCIPMPRATHGRASLSRRERN